MNESKILIGTALDSHVRFYIGDTTKLCEDARAIHDLWPTSLAALGRDRQNQGKACSGDKLNTFISFEKRNILFLFGVYLFM